MEYKEIKQLMDDMGESKLSSLDIEFPDGVKISMTKTTEKEAYTGETEYRKTEIIKAVSNCEDLRWIRAIYFYVITLLK